MVVCAHVAVVWMLTVAWMENMLITPDEGCWLIYLSVILWIIVFPNAHNSLFSL